MLSAGNCTYLINSAIRSASFGTTIGALPNVALIIESSGAFNCPV